MIGSRFFLIFMDRLLKPVSSNENGYFCSMRSETNEVKASEPCFCCWSQWFTSGDFVSSDLSVLTNVSPTLRQNSGVNKSTSLGPPVSSWLSNGPSSKLRSSWGQKRVSTKICNRSASKFCEWKEKMFNKNWKISWNQNGRFLPEWITAQAEWRKIFGPSTCWSSVLKAAFWLRLGPPGHPNVTYIWKPQKFLDFPQSSTWCNIAAWNQTTAKRCRSTMIVLRQQGGCPKLNISSLTFSTLDFVGMLQTSHATVSQNH